MIAVNAASKTLLIRAKQTKGAKVKSLLMLRTLRVHRANPFRSIQ